MGEIILPASDDREAKAKEIREEIGYAKLRVSLDQERGRETPEAVIRLANLEVPKTPQPGRKIQFEDRTDAAAKAMSHAWRNMHTNESLGFQNMLAQHAIAASDAVMFSEETLKRAETALEKEFTVERETGEYDATTVFGTPAEIVRAVIAALKNS